MKAYWVANYTEIKDDERLKKYAAKAREAVEKYSGKIIARSANNITLEGREMVRVALAEFPDIETAKNCYNSEEYIEARKHFVFQEGQSVFKAAVTSMADVSEEIMKRNNLTSKDVAWLVPHQANQRIIDATARRIGVGNEKVMLNIEKYGNTTNGTIPLCLWEWENQLRKGDNLILAAFGGGFTWGSIYLKWAYDSNK